jgi:hypothetical protein
MPGSRLFEAFRRNTTTGSITVQVAQQPHMEKCSDIFSQRVGYSSVMKTSVLALAPFSTTDLLFSTTQKEVILQCQYGTLERVMVQKTRVQYPNM